MEWLQNNSFWDTETFFYLSHLFPWCSESSTISTRGLDQGWSFLKSTTNQIQSRSNHPRWRRYNQRLNQSRYRAKQIHLHQVIQAPHCQGQLIMGHMKSIPLCARWHLDFQLKNCRQLHYWMKHWTWTIHNVYMPSMGLCRHCMTRPSSFRQTNSSTIGIWPPVSGNSHPSQKKTLNDNLPVGGKELFLCRAIISPGSFVFGE